MLEVRIRVLLWYTLLWADKEEKQGFNVDCSMKTDAHCIAEATELHAYTAKEATQFQRIR